MKAWTKQFALRVMRLAESLPDTKTANVISRQILRSATSVGANYRAACRAKSRADFLNKLSIVEEEADETAYWLELLVEGKIIEENRIANLQKEADEILSIVVTSIKTTKNKIVEATSEKRSYKAGGSSYENDKTKVTE